MGVNGGRRRLTGEERKSINGNYTIMLPVDVVNEFDKVALHLESKLGFPLSRSQVMRALINEYNRKIAEEGK
jgi:hypothetical protein